MPGFIRFLKAQWISDLHYDTRYVLHRFLLSGNILNNLVFKYLKRLLLRCIHHFISDLINNMDHMRILGTETSSVILSQTK